MVQLLADRATEGIGATDSSALHEWLAMNPGVDADAFERAAAVLALVCEAPRVEAFPAWLRMRVLADAETFFFYFDGT
jgi:hypothetical protein